MGFTIAGHMVGNYLRVRGEYMGISYPQIFGAELPPRARRIPIARSADGAPRGTTSACAENTKIRFRSLGRNRNYLRVRGEYIALQK